MPVPALPLCSIPTVPLLFIPCAVAIVGPVASNHRLDRLLVVGRRIFIARLLLQFCFPAQFLTALRNALADFFRPGHLLAFDGIGIRL